MKTVMKKMFSLMLVAVMLVGVMPFAAFATEVESGSGTTTYSLTFDLKVNDNDNVTATRTKDGLSGDVNLKDVAEYLFPGYTYQWTSKGKNTSTLTITEDTTLTVRMNCNHSNGYNEVINTQPTCTESGLKTLTCKTEGCNDSHTEVIPALNHDWNDWVVLESATCIATGTEKRTCKNDASHVETKTIPQNADAHNFSGGKCTLCGMCKYCLRIGEHTENCRYYCNGTTNCPNDPNIKDAHNEGCLKTKCNKNGCTKDYGHTDECSVPCTKTAGCILKQNHSGDCNTPCTDKHCDFNYGHSGKHSYLCPVSGCELPVNHEGKHSNEYTHPNGTSKVKIYVNLYTGDVLTKTEPLVVYNEDPNTSISDSIAEHKDLIYAELEDQYSGYEWSGNVYDSENEDGENMNSKVGKGINVHINAHSKENIVYLYVHNARTYDRIGIVRLHGKKVGEAVKESEVRKAVKEYFSFSSLKMYDTEKWDLYVDGKDVKSDDTLTVGSNHYVIDVKISGSAKNTSGAKADSSNPKTGDAIFAPAAVLGLSATTLAVLFYLNKKRAY